MCPKTYTIRHNLFEDFSGYNKFTMDNGKKTTHQDSIVTVLGIDVRSLPIWTTTTSSGAQRPTIQEKNKSLRNILYRENFEIRHVEFKLLFGRAAFSILSVVISSSAVSGVSGVPLRKHAVASPIPERCTCDSTTVEIRFLSLPHNLLRSFIVY